MLFSPHWFPHAILPSFAGAKDQFDSALLCCNSLVANGVITGDFPGRGVCADTALSTCWVADLAGKRCIQLPSTDPAFADARCTDFGGFDRLVPCLSACTLDCV
jgi:hypothetical protein